MLLSVVKRLSSVSSKFTRYLSTMANPVVKIKDGQLRGSKKKLCDDSEYYSFKGIPYAQPPLGTLRFKAPLPVKPWNGIHDASKHGNECPQFDVYTQQIKSTSEDCLYLNVYTKSLDSNAKKPVMVFIHGGGFMFGSGNSSMFGPEFLIQHDIVLVTINYRLEVFGFLCLDTPEVPGNAGMKDQVLALHWVQNNISHFGGDHNNVTIFGESAGAASVTYHLASPMSKGLFHKAISQSGTCTMDWAYTTDATSRAYRLCKILGKDINNPKEAMEFLQSVPHVDLIRKTIKTMTDDEKVRGLPIHFVPVVEKFANNAFLPEKPEDVLMKGKGQNVPLMIGYNNKEGMTIVPLELRKLDYKNANPSAFLPKNIYNTVSSDKRKELGKKIKEYYNNGKDWTKTDFESLCSLISDLYFVTQTHIYAYNYAMIFPSQSIYMYKFNYDTELNILKSLMGMDIKGASHADELFYIFSNYFNKDLYKENKKLKYIVDQVTRLWTDFAKTGNPISTSPQIKWSSYTTSGKEYLNIDESFSPGKYADRENVEFWNKLYQDAGLLHISKSKL